MRLRLGARTRAMVRRLPAGSVYTVPEFVLLAALAIQCARLAWVIATPVSPLGEWRPAEPVVPGDPVGLLRGFDAFFGGEEQAGPAPVTALALSLYGTRIDEATGRSSAIVAGADKIQRSVSVGEEIAPGVRLKAVAFDHITIERGGVAEDLFLDQSGGAPVVRPVAASAAALPTPIAPGQLAADIGFVPRIEGGEVSGLSVRAQGSGAAFRAAGLRDGDVIVSLGGRPVSGQGDLERIGRAYADGGTVPMIVERGGQRIPLGLVVTPR